MGQSQRIVKKYNIGIQNESFSNYVSFFAKNLETYGEITVHAKNKLHRRIIDIKKENRKYAMVIKEESRNKGKNLISISLCDNSRTKKDGDLVEVLNEIESTLSDMFPKMKQVSTM
jgi:hypothetical protein